MHWDDETQHIGDAAKGVGVGTQGASYALWHQSEQNIVDITGILYTI